MSNFFETHPHKIRLHSGAMSDFKINCDVLTHEDIETLAYLISQKIKFYNVVGIPNGGTHLANALKKYISYGGVMLIVDDVLTTGRSMEKARETYWSHTPQGVVIFARGKCPDWITPIFQLNNFFEETLHE